MRKRLNKKGFTLAELLIVVAIIGVLVAISIPIFTAQLEKAREATDVANIRAAYAEVMSDALTDTGKTSTAANSDTDLIKVARTGDKDGSFTWKATITLKQAQDGWQSGIDNIGGIDVSKKNPKAGKTATVTYAQSGTNANKAVIAFAEQ